jgi:homopolymeric O-antigen transport system permease protein
MSPTAESGSRRRHHVVLKPRRRWAPIDLRALWEFRDLLRALGIRDTKLRYRQTALGVIWVVLQPLLAAGVFSFVFGSVAHLPSDGVPYFVFSYTGLLAWNAFSSTLTKAATSVVGNAAMVSKVFFPRMLLPLSIIASTLIDFVVALVLMAVLLATNSIALTWAVLLLPVWLVLVLALGLGSGLLACSLMVRYRDVQYILPIVTGLLLYASPVAYSLASVPKDARSIFLANPLAGLLEGFRWSLLGTHHLTLGIALWAGFASLLILTVGAYAFAALERDFADVI